jgi:hypothetical protein
VLGQWRWRWLRGQRKHPEAVNKIQGLLKLANREANGKRLSSAYLHSTANVLWRQAGEVAPLSLTCLASNTHPFHSVTWRSRCLNGHRTLVLFWAPLPPMITEGTGFLKGKITEAVRLSV